MDFKALLSSRIAASKPSTPTATPTVTSAVSSTNTAVTPSQSQPKYIRRADLEAARQKAYLEDQQRLERERQEKLKRKREAEDEEAERQRVREEKKQRLAEESRARREKEEAEEEARRRKRLGLPVLDVPADSSDVDNDDDDDGKVESETEIDLTTLSDIEDEELQTRLKTLDESATLPDETHTARLQRYYRQQARKAKQDARRIERGKQQQKQKRTIYYPGAIPSTLAPLPADQIVLPLEPPPPTDEQAYLLHHRKLISYINLLLATWQKTIDNANTSSISNSTSHMNSSKILPQVVSDLTPLIHRLSTLSLPTHLLTPLTRILSLTQQRHYRAATDAYLLLSIGRAAWPIGVTMVGIHERSAREKLHEKDDAVTKTNILGDETMRRWLQSVKRCISFAQGRWPPDDLGQLMG